MEKILKKIIDDAQDEAVQITSESEKKADEIKKKAQKEASELSEALVKDAERQGKLEASRIVTQARLKKKIDILSCKKDLINDVLEKAFKMENLGEGGIKRRIVLKDGEREEPHDLEKLKEEIRFLLENEIIEALKI